MPGPFPKVQLILQEQQVKSIQYIHSTKQERDLLIINKDTTDLSISTEDLDIYHGWADRNCYTCYPVQLVLSG